MLFRSGLPVVLVLLLGACSGSSDPKVLPLPTLSSTASPSPTPLVVPSAAVVASPQGAAAFSRYYFSVLNQAFRNRESAGLRELSNEACTTCSALARAVDELATKRQTLVGGAYTVISAEAPPLEGGQVVVDVVYSRTAATTLNEARDVVGRGRAETRTDLSLGLRRTSLAWKVVSLKVILP